jgi:hypothetical protein
VKSSAGLLLALGWRKCDVEGVYVRGAKYASFDKEGLFNGVDLDYIVGSGLTFERLGTGHFARLITVYDARGEELLSHVPFEFTTAWNARGEALKRIF